MPLLSLILACSTLDGDDTAKDRPGRGEDSGVLSGAVLDADPWVSLPYVEVGDTLGEGTFELRNLGDAAHTKELILEVTGPFTVWGDLTPLRGGEARSFRVTSRLSTGEAGSATGAVNVMADDQEATVGLSAIVGTPDLEGAGWKKDAWGTWAVVGLPTAPFPDGHASYDDDSVMIVLPPNFTDNGVMGLVTHLHGHNATLDDVVAEQYLREQFALSGRNAVFIVPQGPEDSADSDFGKLDEPDGYANLVADVNAVLYRDGLVVRLGAAPAATLTSHSGGYSGVANIIQQGGVEISGVHLFDSLYGYESVYADFVRDGGVFRSVYTSGGGTDDNNEALAALLTGEGYTVEESFTDGALADGTLTIGHSTASHGGTVSEDRAFARWLAASGQPPSPTAAPELLATTISDGQAVVRWRVDLGGARVFTVETSEDGETWDTVATTTDTHASIALASVIRVRATDPVWGLSEPSDRYGATGDDWLIVDGFDRVLGGSWPNPTHDFGALVGGSLGAGFSVASNEAVAEGRVGLGDFAHVLWLLGDESTADATFTEAEQRLVTDYVDAGGTIVVSGSEVGWATEASWLEDTLHAALVADDAGTTDVEGWNVGDYYNEDYPDVLSGDETIWEWEGGGAAAVGWDKRVVVIGFGVENLGSGERETALAELRGWLGG
ncbi:hypothetical protein LBMAG42_00260 [Deltaproteobacteria bacterium]|nr:hypothetical protein LBMAG42_00260 [Deltaproteobacteria bacterium]